jgi:alpha-beta hydrolase superfamily lysophospholipase
MTTDTITLTASDGTPIVIHRWAPQTAPVAIIQISHGMAEYAMRYDRFAAALVGKGYIVWAADHRGHGETAGSLDKLGYLADKNGFSRVMEDQHEITLMIRKEYPGIPVILFAHSFGSFIAQHYIETYGDILAGCVLSGTRGPDPAIVVGGKIVTRLVALFRGKKKRSPFLTNLVFGANNAHIPDAKSANAWLSRDAEEVEKYDVSPWCGFTCTAGFYCDMMDGLSRIHSAKNLGKIPKNLPILLVAGTEDPISSYGKTVKKLASIYTSIGLAKVSTRFNDGGRHESLNETNRDEVTRDILDWMNRVLTGAI